MVTPPPVPLPTEVAVDHVGDVRVSASRVATETASYATAAIDAVEVVPPDLWWRDGPAVEALAIVAIWVSSTSGAFLEAVLVVAGVRAVRWIWRQVQCVVRIHVGGRAVDLFATRDRAVARRLADAINGVMRRG